VQLKEEEDPIGKVTMLKSNQGGAERSEKNNEWEMQGKDFKRGEAVGK